MGEVHSRVGAARVITAIIGAALLIAYAALVPLQILVLNPLAAVPGKTLAEIHADAEAADQVLSPVVPIAAGVAGVIIAIVVLFLPFIAPKLGADVIAAIACAALVLGAPVYYFAAFLPGMELADTYSISGGDHAIWGGVLFWVSVVAFFAVQAFVGFAIGRHALGTRVAPAPA